MGGIAIDTGLRIARRIGRRIDHGLGGGPVHGRTVPWWAASADGGDHGGMIGGSDG